MEPAVSLSREQNGQSEKEVTVRKPPGPTDKSFMSADSYLLPLGWAGRWGRFLMTEGKLRLGIMADDEVLVQG